MTCLVNLIKQRVKGPGTVLDCKFFIFIIKSAQFLELFENVHALTVFESHSSMDVRALLPRAGRSSWSTGSMTHCLVHSDWPGLFYSVAGGAG